MIAARNFAKPFALARWTDVLTRRAACPQLPDEVLLHAGPPLRGAPPAPVMNAAIQALLFDERAASASEARDLILGGAVELRPAQDYSVATPLAQVVSASMPMVAVSQHEQICYAPVVEGAAPALRFGAAGPECLQRLRELGVWLDAVVAKHLRGQPLDIEMLVNAAIAQGEECHARTAAANEALIGHLDLGSDATQRLRTNPGFVLPVLMAASAAALRNSRCGVEAIGGNGIDFGVRLRGERAWRQARAEAPRGVRFKGMNELMPLPAIGDSAVVDFCGLGGQALSAAPSLAAEWQAVLPVDALSRGGCIVDPETGIVDAARVVHGALTPLINLAILDQDGDAGLIGRGIYSPPLHLFGDP